MVDYEENQTNDASSSIFRRLQRIYVIGYLLVVVSDTLFDTYPYALYASYGIDRPTIEILYVVSYLSSLCIGTFTASLGDYYGRRLACLLCALFYILKCISLFFRSIWILLLGCICWGIGYAFHLTAFEAWIIQEHRQRGLDTQSLARILRNAFIVSSIVSVGVTISADFLVDLSNYAYLWWLIICRCRAATIGSAAFGIAIVALVVMGIFLGIFWPENYGNKEGNVQTSFILPLKMLRADPRIVLLGLSSSLCDASLYVFLVEWTPTLERANKSPYHKPLPLGAIFALYMLFMIIGTFIFHLLTKRIRVQTFMIVVLLFNAISLIGPVIVPNSFVVIFGGFLLFHICDGIYRPSFALLRSQYIPDEIRTAMMSYMRVPQMIIILAILLIHFSLSNVFLICVTMNILSMLCMIALRCSKLPEEQVHGNECVIVLDSPSTPLFEIKRSQIQSFSTLDIPQVPTKAEYNSLSTSEINQEKARE